jgi:hypothetical protein
MCGGLMLIAMLGGLFTGVVIGNHYGVDRRAALRLRAALQKIAERPMGLVFSAGFAPDDAELMQDIARAALTKEKRHAD